MAAVEHRPLVVIVGETASGKSDLAMQLAERFDGEIIAADSWTVYPGFTVGTAKPSALEQAKVPHHMIDVADPAEGYSAAIYKGAALAAIENITEIGRLPILVGGTGLYVDSVLYNYSFLPKPENQNREHLNSMTLEQLLTYARNKGLSTEAIDVRNKRRLIRLIENDGKLPSKAPIRPNTLILGLRIPPEELDGRIVKRVDKMFEAGLADEVLSLAAQYGWDIEPMKGVGYKEFQQFASSEHSLEQVRESIIRNTRQLAKKQRTWFKRNKSVHWISDPREAVDLVTTFLDNYHIK